MEFNRIQKTSGEVKVSTTFAVWGKVANYVNL